MSRSKEQLRNDQAAIMEGYRREGHTAESVAMLPRPRGTLALSLYGRVSQVVASDPTYGPHLKVAPQHWTGTPPAAADSGGLTQVCYPDPNHVVGDYSVNDYVRIEATQGALVAELL